MNKKLALVATLSIITLAVAMVVQQAPSSAPVSHSLPPQPATRIAPVVQAPAPVEATESVQDQDPVDTPPATAEEPVTAQADPMPSSWGGMASTYCDTDCNN